MKIGFHTNQLSLRGTEVSMYDYAKYSEEILGHKSFILTKEPSIWKYSDTRAIEKFKNRFDVFFYKDIDEIESILDENNADMFYAQKAGLIDGVISTKRKTVVHAVFQEYQPHGNVYAFISEWLSELYGNKHDFVPYMVDLPNINDDMRDQLNIPKNAIVYGRYGGVETFDISFVKKVINKIVNKRNDIYFLFMNTEKFTTHNNVIFLSPTTNVIEKTRFINSCDAMLHARLRGESFGLAIGEFSIRNKPIICFNQAIDGAHFKMLGAKGIYYSDADSLDKILNEHSFMDKKNDNWNCYSEYSPEKVINKFKNVFID